MAKRLPIPVGAETPFAFLLACANDDVKARLAEWLKEDPERLLLLLKRSVNPVASFTNEEEGKLRGMHRETVGKLKAASRIPQEPS